MSRYEIIKKELKTLRVRQFVSCLGPSVCVGTILGLLMNERWQVAYILSTFVFTTIVTCIIFHFLLQHIAPAYARWSVRIRQIITEMEQIKVKIAQIFSNYPERPKGQQFKIAYKLANKQLQQMEETLAVGMYREQREVFVTAFMANQIAVRVTASIGSPYRCSASDNPAKWPFHIEKNECDSIRQYHNHPVHDGNTIPSPTDFKTSRLLQKILGPHSAKLRSFIICWNEIGEWKIIEYDANGHFWLHTEYDAFAEQVIEVNMGCV